MSDESIIKAVLAHGGRVMLKQPDGSYREVESKTDWQRVQAMTDEEIEAAAHSDPDAAPLDDAFWAKARVVVTPRLPKKHQGIRLDMDVLDWFKAQGPGWQTRMNAVLKSYVRAQKRHEPK